ncbi:VOC family protein [Streptomyces sp. CA-252508]|uniref:VOC family protein n=1 Tax=Streptomyces sp. CA-252508 TaxID=3418946 RepID=UPI003D936200
MQARPEGGDGLIGRLRCTLPDRPDPRAPARFHRAPLRGRGRPPGLPLVARRGPGDPAPGRRSGAGVPAGGPVPAARPDPSRPQQFHPDAGVPGPRADPYLPPGLGAVPLDDGDPARGRHVRADPAGHPFRLVRD